MWLACCICFLSGGAYSICFEVALHIDRQLENLVDLVVWSVCYTFAVPVGVGVVEKMAIAKKVL